MAYPQVLIVEDGTPAAIAMLSFRAVPEMPGGETLLEKDRRRAGPPNAAGRERPQPLYDWR